MLKQFCIPLLSWLCLWTIGYLLLANHHSSWLPISSFFHSELFIGALALAFLIGGMLSPGFIISRWKLASRSIFPMLASIMGLPLGISVVGFRRSVFENVTLVAFVWLVSSGVILGFLHAGAGMGAKKK